MGHWDAAYSSRSDTNSDQKSIAGGPGGSPSDNECFTCPSDWYNKEVRDVPLGRWDAVPIILAAGVPEAQSLEATNRKREVRSYT